MLRKRERLARYTSAFTSRAPTTQKSAPRRRAAQKRHLAKMLKSGAKSASSPSPHDPTRNPRVWKRHGRFAGAHDNQPHRISSTAWRPTFPMRTATSNCRRQLADTRDKIRPLSRQRNPNARRIAAGGDAEAMEETHRPGHAWATGRSGISCAAPCLLSTRSTFRPGLSGL